MKTNRYQYSVKGLDLWIEAEVILPTASKTDLAMSKASLAVKAGRANKTSKRQAIALFKKTAKESKYSLA